MPATGPPNDAAELVDDWIAARKARMFIRSAETEKAYRGDMARWARHLSPTGHLTGMPIHSINARTLDQAVTALADEGVAVRTRRRMFTVMRGLCRWATRQGHLPSDPTDTDDFTLSARPAQHLPPHFTDEELSRIVIAVSLPPSRSWSRWSIRDRAMFAILIGTGVRASELCGLTPNDIISGNPARIRIVGKGDKERRVAIDPETVRILNMWLDSRAPVIADTDTTALFVDRKGLPMTESKLRTAVLSWLNQAKVTKPDGTAIHAFRHTFAYRLVMSGQPIPVVQAVLGHASLTTTSIYTRMTATDTAGIIDTLDTGSLLRGHTNQDDTRRAPSDKKRCLDTIRSAPASETPEPPRSNLGECP